MSLHMVSPPGYNGTLPYVPDVYVMDIEDTVALLTKLLAAKKTTRRSTKNLLEEKPKEEAEATS